MKRSEALRYATSKLKEAFPDTAIISDEAEILLLHSLGLDRIKLYLEPHQELLPQEEIRLSQYLERRLNLEPVPYIIGYAEFFGLKFSVNPSVLIPRPESELLIERVLAYIEEKQGSLDLPLTIADIGTGCGCLAIALGLSLPQSRILATDLSKAALLMAGENIIQHKLSHKIELLEGDLLEPVYQKVDIIVANLPYILEEEYAELSRKELKYEPALALAGGPDGLHHIGRLLAQAPGRLLDHGCLLLEVGAGQATKVAERALDFFPRAKVDIYRDLGDIERVVQVSL